MSSAVRALSYFGSILIALVLQFIALPPWLAPERPLWLPMVLVFWALAAPELPNLTMALIVGLCCDTLVSSALGSHALALMLPVYVAGRLRPTLSLMPWWQEAIALTPLWVLYAAAMTGLDALADHYADPLLRWLPTAVTAVLWTPVAAMLSRLHTPAPAE